MNAFGSAWVAAQNFPRRIYRIKESVIWASVLAETDFGPAFWNRDEVCVHGVVLLPGRVLLGHVNAKLFHLGQKFRLVITQRTSGKQIQKSSENWMLNTGNIQNLNLWVAIIQMVVSLPFHNNFMCKGLFLSFVVERVNLPSFPWLGIQLIPQMIPTLPVLSCAWYCSFVD